MIRNSGKIQQNIYISIIMLIAIASQILFLTDSQGYYNVFIPIGVAAGFYVSFGKRVVPGIVISTFVGVFVFSLLFSDKNVIESLLYTIPILFINALGSHLMLFFLNYFKCKTPDTVLKGTKYLTILVLISILASTLPAIQYTIKNDSNFLFELWKMYQPIYMGLAIFSTTILLSNIYDDYISYKSLRKYQNLLFIIVFFTITYIIFSELFEGIDFWSFAPVIIVLFMVNAFVFNYRMLLLISYLFILISKITYLDELNHLMDTKTQTLLNIYLMVLLMITVFTKVLLRETNDKNIELTETKEKFSGMLDSTISLLSIRDTVVYDDINYHENFIKKIFDIAMKIFPEIEYGSCAIHSAQEVKVLNVKGYDLDFFLSLKIPTNKYDYSRYTPLHSKDPMKDFRDALGDRYPLVKDDLPKVKESVRILIKLGEGFNGILLFDIMEASIETFTENDINNIGAFQNMINSFYEMNELAINNNNLKDDIVLSLIRTLELYDQYTGGHSEDVATLSRLLAEKMNLSKSEIYDIYWAGIVHDIGKIGIKSEIINKTSRLTLDEYKQVQNHSIYGFEILNRSSELKNIAKLVKHHHEWHNGSGYPDGLKHNEIPIGAQILQVADSVSSMATRRSYQKEKSFDKIIAELEMYKGTQFNPVICDHMIKLINSGIIENYFDFKKKS